MNKQRYNAFVNHESSCDMVKAYNAVDEVTAIQESMNSDYDDDFNDNGEGTLNECIDDATTQFLLEALSYLPEEKVAEFYASEEFQALQEAGKMPQQGFVAMTKDASLKQRIASIAIAIERHKNTALYKEYKKAKDKYKDAQKKIIAKNRVPASKTAKIQFMKYSKTASGKSSLAYAKKMLTNFTKKK